MQHEKNQKLAEQSVRRAIGRTAGRGTMLQWMLLVGSLHNDKSQRTEWGFSVKPTVVRTNGKLVVQLSPRRKAFRATVADFISASFWFVFHYCSRMKRLFILLLQSALWVQK